MSVVLVWSRPVQVCPHAFLQPSTCAHVPALASRGQHKCPFLGDQKDTNMKPGDLPFVLGGMGHLRRHNL